MLCDDAGIDSREIATRLLREGIRKGLISAQQRDGYPQNVWSVSGQGVPLEAQLGGERPGTYHGYPMPEPDPFREAILRRCNQA